MANEETTLVPNTRVIIKISVKENSEVYQSRVEDVTQENVVLAMPMQGGTIVPIQVGERVEVSYTLNDGVYLFKGTVTDRKSQPLPLLYLTLPREIKRQQRRQFVRVETFIPIRFRKPTQAEWEIIYDKCTKDYRFKGASPPPPLKTEAEVSERKPPFHQGVVHNISGGGMLIACAQKIANNDMLLMRFALDEAEEIEVYARVARCYELSGEDTSFPFSAGLEYVVITSELRHKIIQYTFNRQIQLKKKGISES